MDFLQHSTSLQVKIFAPNIDQMHVVDHLKGSPTEEKRNVLVESARLARGDIQDLSELNVKELDAIIFPGKHTFLMFFFWRNVYVSQHFIWSFVGNLPE